MDERKTRICVCCGTKYLYCPKCNEDKDKPHWYFTFCGDNCHNLYDVLTKYEWEQITAVEAKTQLEKLDLSKVDTFGESYKNTLNKIMSNVSKTKVEETIVEEVISEEVIDKTEGNEENETPKRRKNKRVETDIE